MGSPFPVIAPLLGAFVAALLWLGAALYVWADATNRGMPGAFWWAVGTVFTGPAGLIAYLIDRARGRLVPCSFCGQLVDDKSPVCPFCSRPLDSARWR